MMSKKDFEVFDLEVHKTRDISDSHVNGELTVIWRDWDKIIKNPEMVYINIINSKENKGPHIHKKRTSYFYCLEGKIVLIIKDKKGLIHEIETNSKEHKLISVSAGIAASILNPSDYKSKVLVLADISWRPDDDEMENVIFDNYSFDKWK